MSTPTDFDALKKCAKSIREGLSLSRRHMDEAIRLRMRAMAMLSVASESCSCEEHIETFYAMCGLSKATADRLCKGWDDVDVDATALRMLIQAPSVEQGEAKA